MRVDGGVIDFPTVTHLQRPHSHTRTYARVCIHDIIYVCVCVIINVCIHIMYAYTHDKHLYFFHVLFSYVFTRVFTNVRLWDSSLWATDTVAMTGPTVYGSTVCRVPVFPLHLSSQTKPFPPLQLSSHHESLALCVAAVAAAFDTITTAWDVQCACDNIIISSSTVGVILYYYLFLRQRIDT